MDTITHHRLTLRASLALGLAALSLCTFLLLTGCQKLPGSPARVVVAADGERRTLETQSATVRDLLAEVAITLGPLDQLQPPETAQIRDGLIITVTRVIQNLETVTETVAFGRQLVRDASLTEGETRLLQAGQPGIRERIYRVTIEDGQEIERTLIKNALTRTPQDEVLLIGTQPRVTTVPIEGTLAYLEHQDAWVMRSSSANARRITALGDLDGRVFTLSPDGKQLLFTRALTDSDHFNARWLINTLAADAEPREVAITDLLWADWNPDGKEIAWTTAEPIERAPGWRGENDLWLATLSTQGRLTNRREILKAEAGGGYGWWGSRYQWSPDGEMLAYARPDEVGIVDLDEKETVPLATFPAYRTYSSWAWAPEIAWFPEGSLIATVLHGPTPGDGDPEESPVFDLWVLDVTATYSAELASEVGMWAAPQVSSDGETLLFGKASVPYQSHITSYGLCTLDRDGSNRSCFYPPEGEAGIEIPGWLWSPDRSFIAFILRDNLYLLREGETTALSVTDQDGVTTLDWK